MVLHSELGLVRRLELEWNSARYDRHAAPYCARHLRTDRVTGGRHDHRAIPADAADDAVIDDSQTRRPTVIEVAPVAEGKGC
jgi:hypothetical protein